MAGWWLERLEDLMFGALTCFPKSMRSSPAASLQPVLCEPFPRGRPWRRGLKNLSFKGFIWCGCQKSMLYWNKIQDWKIFWARKKHLWKPKRKFSVAKKQWRHQDEPPSRQPWRRFGFDFTVDQDLQVWLIEVNHKPGMMLGHHHGIPWPR